MFDGGLVATGGAPRGSVGNGAGWQPMGTISEDGSAFEDITIEDSDVPVSVRIEGRRYR